MGVVLGDNKKDQKQKEQWQMIMDGIVAKRTHEPAFQELFDQILKDNQHDYHRQAQTLWMLYDFTPIQPVEKE